MQPALTGRIVPDQDGYVPADPDDETEECADALDLQTSVS